MKKQIVFLTIFSLIFANLLFAGGSKPELIKNGEEPQISTDGATTTFTYQDYVVTTVKGSEGDSVTIKKKSDGEPFEFCSTEMNTYFYGINGKYMYVLSKGGFFSTLISFNLDEMDMDPYNEFVIFDGGAEVDGSKLIVWNAMEYASPDIKAKLEKKAEKLENQDKQVFYFQKRIYDYSSKELTELDEYDCAGVNY